MISAKPWSADAAMILVAGVVACLFIGLSLAWLLEAVHPHFSPDNLEFAQTTIVILCFQGASLGWIALFLRVNRISWREAFGLPPSFPGKTIALGAVAGVLVLPLMWVLQWLSQLVMPILHLTPVAQTAVTELQKPGLSAAQKIAFGVFTILLAPVAEEVLFRGILYPSIKQAGRPRLALWGTSTFFAALHLNAASLVPLLVLALILVFLYEFSESLLAPILAHSIFNAANFFYLLLVS
jgi:membrane protease YdiL (CAAX protease family)